VIVSVDGLTYTNPTDYSVAGTTVTFVDIPNSGSTISVKGFVNTGNATGSYSGSFVGDGSGLTTLPISVTKDEYQYTANGVTTNYTLSRLYDISSLNVSVAGLRYAPITDYTLNLFTLSFLTAPPSGANIYIDAFVNTPSVATGSFSGSFNGNFNIANATVTLAQSASYAENADLLDGLNSTVFATTGSNVFVGNQRITGSVILSSSLPTELQIIGDTEITGSLRLLSGGITASLLGTSSFATTTNNLNGGTTNYIPLWSSTTAQSSSTISQNAGNIGINVAPASIQARLHVSGGSIQLDNNTGLRILDNAGTAESVISLSTANNLSLTSPTVGGSIIYAVRNSAGAHQFLIGGIEYARIASSGNVGIGITNPSASLHVSGTTMVDQIIEKVNITGSAPPATFNVDLTSGSIFFRSASTSANWTTNFRGNATTPLNNMLFNGQSITATVLVYNGATAYSASAYQIDGVSIIPRWQGGTSGSANTNSLDAHQFTIIKVASASYVMLGSITKYS
jgi:hypothetical protein